MLRPTPIPPILALLVLLGSGSAAAEETPWPTRGWAVSTPEEQGVDSARLAALLEHVREEGLALRSLLVVRHGRLVSETYFAPYHRETLQEVASVTKSVTTAAVGVAIARGKLRGVDQPVLSFFPEYEPRPADPRKAALTVEHLLTMTSGLAWDPVTDNDRMWNSRDWARYALERPMACSPGERFAYVNGASQLLSAIVQRSTGRSLAALAREALFEPMGIRAFHWDSDGSGVTKGYTNLIIAPESLAKLGYLYLHEGRWEGRQLVPAEWVRASTRTHVHVEGATQVEATYGYAYGYGWWVDPWGGFSAQGWAGQSVYVVPAQDLVVVFTAGERNEVVVPTLMRSFLLAALDDQPLPANPAALARLRELSRAAESPAPRPVPAPPPLAGKVSGRPLVFEPNAPGFTRAVLRFDGGATAQLELATKDGRAKLAVGLDRVFRRVSVPGLGEVAALGQWLDGSTFEVTRWLLPFEGPQTLEFHFDGERVRLELKDPLTGTAGTATGRVER